MQAGLSMGRALQRSHHLSDGNACTAMIQPRSLGPYHDQSHAVEGKHQDDSGMHQFCSQEPTSALEPPRHRTGRPPELSSGFGVGFALEITEDDRSTVFLGKLAKRLIDHPAQVPAFHVTAVVGYRM